MASFVRPPASARSRRRLLAIVAVAIASAVAALAAPAPALARVTGVATGSMLPVMADSSAGAARVRPAQPRPLHPSPAAARRLGVASQSRAFAAPRAAAAAIDPDLAWSDGTRLQHNLSPTTFGPLNNDGMARSVAGGPDGSRYAVALNAGAGTRHADGTGVLDGVVSGQTVTDLAWGHSGERIASVATPAGAGALPHILVAFANGASTVPLAVAGVITQPTIRDADWLDFDTLVISSVAAGESDARLGTLVASTGALTPLVPSDPSAGVAGTSLHDVAVSRDGARIAYVQTDATSSTLWAMDADGSGAHMLAAGSVGVTGSPVFSVDGQTVYQANATATGSEIRAYPFAGGASTVVLAPATAQVIGLSVRPVAGPLSPDRIAGQDRIDTAIAASRFTWADAAANETCENFGAQAVVLARSDQFPDALSAGPLATTKCGPLLITAPTTLDPRVADEIRRVLAPGRTVYLVGGTGALSPAIATQVQALGYATQRFAGPDRFATAVEIAKGLAATNTSNTFVFATGLNFPDALTGGPLAAANGWAILLTNGATQPQVNIDFLNTLPSPFAVAVGGDAVRAVPGALAVSGHDRYDTNALAATQFFYPPFAAILAVGNNFPDALTGGAMAGSFGQPLLLTPPGGLPPGVATLIDTSSASVDFVAALGGTGVLPLATVAQAVALTGGRIPG